MKEKFTALIAVILLSSLIGAGIWYSLHNNIQAVKYIPSESSPDFTSQNITMVRFNEKGTAKMKLNAKELVHYSNEHIFLKMPQATLVSPGKPNTYITSDEGKSENGGLTVLLKGNVQILRNPTKNMDALTLTTNELFVDNENNTITTSSHVNITQGNNRLEGDGLIFKNEEQTIYIKRRVKSVFYPQRNNSDLLNKR